jgi:hypothetical protein
MLDIDAETKKMRNRGWLRRPELDEDRMKPGEKLRTEAWELPDGRLYKRLWISHPSNDPEYIGSILQVVVNNEIKYAAYAYKPMRS